MAREFPYPPRMMTRPRAAHYLDLTEAGFEREVLAGRLPHPMKLDGRDHWDRKVLDAWLDGDSGRDWRKDQPLYAA